MLSWDSVSRSSYYEVSISRDSNFQNVLGDYTGLRVDRLSIGVGDLEPSTIYYYRVRSVNGGSASGYSIGFVKTLLLSTPDGSYYN